MSSPINDHERFLINRGNLWLGRRGSQHLLFRALDRHLADIRFRRAISDLHDSLAAEPVPRALAIVDHDFHGDQYFLAYRLDWPVRSVPMLFSTSHWLERLRFIADAASMVAQWEKKLPLPLGLHGEGLVACRVNNTWVAHIAPCPQISYSCPLELTRTDTSVLAGIAPERIRGLRPLGIMEDIFAAGALVLSALGSIPFAGTDVPEEQIEIQARALSFTHNHDQLGVENALWAVFPARERIRHLAAVARRCCAYAPEARPQSFQDLQTALAGVLAFSDWQSFSSKLDPADALQFLEWAINSDGVHRHELDDARMVAARLAQQLRMPSRELHYLQNVDRQDAPHRRMVIQYEQYVRKAPIPPGTADPEGDKLLAELEKFRPLDVRGLEPDERISAKEDSLRAAMIFLRRGDLYNRARELFAVTQLDARDIDALFLYGLSLKDMQAEPNTMRKLVEEAKKRLKGLQDLDELDREDVATWNERFQSQLLR